jgi:hypothetical protein
MKNTILFLLLALAGYAGHAQHTVLKTGVYHHYRSFENNKPSDETGYTLVPFIRVNKIDRNYNDTLYRLLVNGEEKRNYGRQSLPQDGPGRKVPVRNRKQ